MNATEPLVSLKAAARSLGVTRYRLQWALKQGRLPYRERRSGRTYVALAEVATWLTESDHREPWSAAELAYLRTHYAAASVATVATALGRTVTAVKSQAHELGLTSATRLGHQSVREDYFAVIATTLQAYILGLLAADGCVRSATRFALKVHVKDRSLLELVRREIAPLRTIEGSASRKDCVLAISSRRLVSDLARYGVTPRKSLTLQWPEALPSALTRPYLLGYFDGDGSAYLQHGRYPRWALCSGSVPFLERAAETIIAATGAKLDGPRKNTTSKAHYLAAWGKYALAIDTWLHLDEGLGLQRKRLSSLLNTL